MQSTPSQKTKTAVLYLIQLTNHGLYDPFCHLNELLVDLDGEVTQHLTVFCQVKVLQTVFVLFAGVLRHKGLYKKTSLSSVSLLNYTHIFGISDFIQTKM